MSLFRFPALLICLFACSCTRVNPLSPEEVAAIQENFQQAIVDFISQKEGKKITSFELSSFRQTGNDEVKLAYEVTSQKSLEAGETANTTFHASMTLKRGPDGVWNAVEMSPRELSLEFSKGLSIASKLPSVPASKK